MVIKLDSLKSLTRKFKNIKKIFLARMLSQSSRRNDSGKFQNRTESRVFVNNRLQIPGKINEHTARSHGTDELLKKKSDNRRHRNVMLSSQQHFG